MEGVFLGNYRLKKIFLSAALLLGLFTRPASALQSVYYQSPDYSTDTGRAVSWLVGDFEFHRSTTDGTPYIILSSTGGVSVTFGIVATTITATTFYGDGSNLTGITGGGAGGGATTLAVSTGSFQASNVVSSPTAIVNLDSATFQVQLKSGATAFIRLSDIVSLITSTKTWPATQNFSSGTFTSLGVSSFSVTGGTLCIGQTCMFFGVSSTAPPAGVDQVFHLLNGKAYFGGDATGASATGGSDNLGSHVATTTFQVNGQAIIGSSQVLVGVTTGQATVVISSPNASLVWDAIRIDTGAAAPLYDFQYASATIAPPATFYVLSPFIQGSTISAQTEGNFNQSYIARYGPLKNGPTASSLQSGLFPYLYTSLGSLTKIGFMNAGGGVLEWGLTNGPLGFIGMLTNQALQVRINDTEVQRWDTTGSIIGASGGNPKVLYGYTTTASSGVYTSTLNVYGLISSTSGALLAGTTIQGTLTISGGSITANGIALVISPVAPTNGQVPTFNSANNLIEFKTPSAGGSGVGSSFIYDGTQNVLVSTVAYPGATISFNGTASTVTYIPIIFSTYTALTSTGTSLSALWTVTKSTWDFMTAFMSTVSAMGTTVGQRTVVGYNGGTALSGGNITAITAGTNMTASQSGSTITVNATGGSGSLTYSLIAGTQGAVGVDVFVSSISNFNLILSSFGAAGLTTSTTGYGQLFFRDGVYKISNATIPAGVTIVCGSSVTFVDELISATQFTVYGKMQNCNYDMNATARSAKVIRMQSSSQLTGFKIYNFPSGQGTAAAGTFAFCTLCVEASSNVKVQGDFSNFITNNDSLRHGDQATFMVLDSTNVDIQVNPTFGASVGNSSTFIFFGRSKTVNYHDSTFLASGGNAIVIGPGNQDIFFERNKLQITQTAGLLGHVVFTGDSGPAFGLVSTGTVSISYNDWDIQTSDAGNILEFDTGGNGRMSGVRIKNNTVHRILATGGTYTFANIASTIAGGTILQGNNMAGLTTFIVDGGDKTLYIGQGNTLNNVEQ